MKKSVRLMNDSYILFAVKNDHSAKDWASRLCEDEMKKLRSAPAAQRKMQI